MKPMKQFLAAVMSALVLCLALTACSASPEVAGTLSDPDAVTVGIAWRADTDSEFYTNIVTALTEAGATPVLLAQVVDNDLAYENGSVAGSELNADGYLSEAAAKVKANAYRHSNAAAVVADVDAVLFTGGEDIAPTLLAQPEDWHHIAAEWDYNATRDVSDYLLMSYCLDHDIPVVGFCRGMQMLAVVSGASMIQDIPTFYAEKGLTYRYGHRNRKATPESYRDYAPHDIRILSEDSLVYRVFGTDTVENVPSWHHQAVKSVAGTKLAVTAAARTDGYDIIEVIERTDKTCAIGFQFHPEAAIVKSLNLAANAGRFMDKTTALKVFRLPASAKSGSLTKAA